MVNRTGSETGGVGAESEGGDAVAVVAKELGGGGRKERVVDGDGGVGRGGGDEVMGLLVPHHRAERRPPIARGFMGFSQFH